MDNKIDLYLRRAVLLIYDVCAVIAAGYLSLFVRFDLIFSAIPVEYEMVVRQSLPMAIIITIVVFALFRLYSSLWTYAGMTEILNITAAALIAGIAELVIVTLEDKNVTVPLPRSYYFYYTIFLWGFVFVSRFIYRGLRAFKKRGMSAAQTNKTRVLIVGAGDAGDALIREIKSSKYLPMKIVGVIDDNQSKVGTYIHGVKVIGTREDIVEKAKELQVDSIYVANI